MGLLTQASVAIDGSKFKAVNNRDKNFTRAKMDRRMAQIEESVGRYLQQLDTADRQEPSEALKTKTSHLKEKIAKLKEQMQRLEVLRVEMLASPDQQISLTDPDSRSMATSGRGSGVVGYNVQVAVDTANHLIITHEVTNVGTDRSQLSAVAKQAKATLEVENLDAVADRGYFSSEQILACEKAGITVTLPKPMTSHSKAEGRFGKQDFRYLVAEDVYICPAGERLTYSFTTRENGLVLYRYSTHACQSCAIKNSCTTGRERRITRWQHEHILEAVQRRLDERPEKMRQRRETVEHPFGTIKARMGATHFLMKTLPRVAAEMALHVRAYNMTRVMNIMGTCMGRLVSSLVISPFAHLLVRPGCDISSSRPAFARLLRGAAVKGGRRPSRSDLPLTAASTAADLRDRGGLCLATGTIPRGSSPSCAQIARHELVFGRSVRIATMMQSCASAAKLREGGPILNRGARTIVQHRVAATSVHQLRPGIDMTLGCSNSVVLTRPG